MSAHMLRGHAAGSELRSAPAPFWQSPLLWALLALGSVVPFLFVSIVPFKDLLNHVGRHYVFLNLADDPGLQSYYSVHWSLIGNLGVDIFVRALGPWLGANLATHVVVALIAPLAIAGIYSLSRALNGEVAPAALLSTVLVINWPLLMGFTNFCLSASVALLVLALWIRLRALSFLVRFLIFTPLVFFTWLCHTAGWGLLGLGIGAFELSRATANGFDLKKLVAIPFQWLSFAPTLLLIILWRQRAANGVAAQAGSDFWKGKLLAIGSVFREHFMGWDLALGALFVAGLIFFLIAGGRRLVRPAAFIAIAFLAAFVACPGELFKSGFADRRLVSYGVMMLPIAIGVAPAVYASAARRRAIEVGAMLCVALFVARMGVSSVVWHSASQDLEAHLAVIDSVPPHSRIFGLVVEGCDRDWNLVGKPDHLQQYALVRRDSMVSGLFQNPGLNQVEAKFSDPKAAFDPDMLATVHDQRCPVPYYIPHTLQESIQGFERDKFDYVWIIGEQPLGEIPAAGLALVQARANDRLYRVTGPAR